MPRFFVNAEQINAEQNTVVLTGADAHHVARSLRMAAGEHITVCDAGAKEYDCVLETFHDETEVIARIVGMKEVTTEPPFLAHLYQGLPKGDKLDNIIQKAVECGAASITPFESTHCVVRIKPDAEEKKTDRRRRIALEAAKQCGRGTIPTVAPSVSFAEALKRASRAMRIKPVTISMAVRWICSTNTGLPVPTAVYRIPPRRPAGSPDRRPEGRLMSHLPG